MFYILDSWEETFDVQFIASKNITTANMIFSSLFPAVTLHTKACASPSLFYFLFVYPFIIIIALLALVVYFYLNPKKPQKSSQENHFWAPIEPITDDLKNEEDTSVI